MNYSHWRVIGHYKQFLWPYKGRFLMAVILAIISSTVWLYNAYAFAKAVSFLAAYHAGQSLRPLYILLATWLAAILIRYVASFFSRYIGIATAERAAIDSEIFTMQHLSQIDIAWHEKENTGNKMKRINRGSRAVVDMTKLFIGTGADIVIGFTGALLIIARSNLKIAAFLFLYLVIYYAISVFARTKGVRALRKGNPKEEEVTGLLFEIASNIRSIKVLGMTDRILQHARARVSEMIELVTKRIFWFQTAGLLEGVWEGLARIGFVSFIIWGIVHGYYQIGFFVLFYGYFNTLTSSVSSLSAATQDIATAKANAGRLISILEEPIGIDREEGKVDFPQEWDTVHIKELSFTYGDSAVLSNVSFDIKKGEKVGIVGLSGAGKSTIFKLLLKEYENYDGEILIGDTPLKAIKKSSYVNHIAAVLQDTEVFNMSLKENIFMANSAQESNKELFERSLSIAHINDFLYKLPLGIETLIGERGVKFSGGERQRLGIARAVFKSPEILFLDEATSHLDVESEQKIQESLKLFFKDVTAVVIAHRLSTIREMDKIIVLEGGKIIESGTFDELHARDGRFRDFWDKQKNT